MDFGAHSLNPYDDYPDFVVPLAEAVVSGKVDRGVAISGSGVGASVCANKVPGVRAGLVHDHFSARQGVEDKVHNTSKLSFNSPMFDPKGSSQCFASMFESEAILQAEVAVTDNRNGTVPLRNCSTELPHYVSLGDLENLA